jgi:hypothetical protein
MDGDLGNEVGTRPRAQVYNPDSSAVTFGEKAGRVMSNSDENGDPTRPGSIGA